MRVRSRSASSQPSMVMSILGSRSRSVSSSPWVTISWRAWKEVGTHLQHEEML